MNAFCIAFTGAGAMYTALDLDVTCGIWIALFCVFLAKAVRR